MTVRKKYYLIIAVLFVLNFLIFILYNTLWHISNWKLAPLMALFIVVSALAILILLAFVITYSAQRKSNLNTDLALSGVFILYIMFLLFYPRGEPEVKYLGCWTGSNSSGKISIYDDGLFEIRWNGLMRGGKYHGDWKQRGDTIYLNYSGDELDRVGSKLYLNDNYLTPVDGVSGLFLREVNFKLNGCAETKVTGF